MPAPPSRDDIAGTGGLSPSNATARTGFGALWDYVTTLLGASGNASDARTALGLAIGTDVQAYDADIATVAASQAEMEAGTEAGLRSMSPLRIAQAVAALASNSGNFVFSLGTPTRNAGAMTVTLDPCTITFRNTSLTAGGVNKVELASGLSLTIPSGAKLGTVNGVAARLALLVAYNGGTPVLCVTNLAGGTNLDGTGLISPTTISASATSASVIYSASAVSANSPYQVVGFLNSTQATAGTYATAPTVIGGSAAQLGAMMTLGYGQTWQDLTASRAAGTTYYNTTGRTIQVSILALIASGTVTARFSVNNVECNWAVSERSDGQYGAIGPIAIPPGASYSLSSSGVSIAASAKWAELR